MVEETAISDDDHNNDETVFVVHDPEQYPHVILKGSLANLSALRQGDVAVRSTFFNERYGVGVDADGGGDDDDVCNGSNPLLMDSPIAASLTVISPSGAAATTTTDGEVFVTRSQILFVARDQDLIGRDWAVGASRIVLHAMTDDEPQSAGVYLQLNDPGEDDGGDGDDDGRPLEMTITPVDGHDCQKLFDCLCKLVSLHPILDGDDYDDYDDYGGHQWQGGGDDGGGGFGFGAGDNDDLIWVPSAGSAFGTTGEGHYCVDDDEDYDDADYDGGATEQERDAMLERLDNLLVERPEYEIQEDQFDDADDTEEEQEEQEEGT
jgi:hypothetical protein